MSLNFEYRIGGVSYYSDGNYLYIDLFIRHHGVQRYYPCTFRFTSANSLRAALSRQNFVNTVERNANFADSPVLRKMELNSDLTLEFEDGFTGPSMHVYDFCKAFKEYHNRKGSYYFVAD